MGDSTEWNDFPEPKAGFPFAYRPPLSLKGRGRAARRPAGGRRPPPAPRAVAPPLTPVRPKTEGLTGKKIGRSFLEAGTASPRRSHRANASGTGAEAFSAMKLRPFPARISETVRNIDRAR